MVLTSELINYASISFITILILDFGVIELVLNLGVFTIGRKWVKIVLLLSLFCHELVTFIFIIGAEKDYIDYATLPFFWAIWNISYYYMLIEQNAYWMSSIVRKRMMIVWGLYSINIAIVFSIFFLMCIFILPLTSLFYVTVFDIIILTTLSLTEIFIVYKIYIFSRDKLKRVSTKLWNKVKVSISICLLGIIMDILIFSLENFGEETLAYLIKPCSFAFKVIFECLCFQFIKGIVVSIEQSQE
ncbi:hypothetical protein CONCODRAFT_12849 [Conidiobolus coronatus NRRL 28638]|uniref:Uncharacterized protein n=1 Tax=Conidiobolus coronatus (strain ATCC 28846 / CBS 209.66 / NRRL 28638) TaxID=796925 RepID=A0A137NS32_CONC2|nr:hypothetical protein CONCODRAFT_12849 [Conidiobolus coronatus NRRL 28638]|eukprot:KXN65534.1 hypothetical protein CONCODRAFT_12849 [Conidiobolus coronatus NRRL 28638]